MLVWEIVVVVSCALMADQLMMHSLAQDIE